MVHPFYHFSNEASTFWLDRCHQFLTRWLKQGRVKARLHQIVMLSIVVAHYQPEVGLDHHRSDKRRVGKECDSTCRSQGVRINEKIKHTISHNKLRQ